MVSSCVASLPSPEDALGTDRAVLLPTVCSRTGLRWRIEEHGRGVCGRPWTALPVMSPAAGGRPEFEDEEGGESVPASPGLRPGLNRSPTEKLNEVKRARLEVTG